MTPKEIALVQTSWRQVQPIADQAAALFYSRLFTLEPSVKRLFKGDMQEQGRKLMQMISVAVNSLARLEGILPAVRALGRRHAGYGVEPRHYSVVGSALIWTLEQGLGQAFTKETEDAWRTAYGVLATTMQEATREHAS
ncbi:MAG TPA: globin family protein [Burkholderiales bacterium]|nr:globin family protein [Burkholderiales bacterium]